MTTEDGRLASPPGSQATPEAATASSPSVSIPIADASQVPDDPWAAFAWLVGKCASGFGGELMARGKTDVEARNSVIGCCLQMAAGEACRIARREGREPDPAKWRKATSAAFERAIQYTANPAQGIEAQRAETQSGSVEDKSPTPKGDAP